MSGDKGVGKSIFAKMLCQKTIEKRYPVVVVDEAYKGIARFIENIEQECVVLFDEFDKTFKSNKENDEQAKFLVSLTVLPVGRKCIL